MRIRQLPREPFNWSQVASQSHVPSLLLLSNFLDRAWSLMVYGDHITEVCDSRRKLAMSVSRP